MATKTTESSVMVALAELKSLEAERIEDQRRAEGARRAADERRRREDEAAAKRETELVRARAESEAKLRVDAEMSRDRSLGDLRAQIAAVQAEREALHDALRERVARAAEPAASKPGAWAMAFGLSSVVAAALAGALVVVQTQRPVELARASYEPAVAPVSAALAAEVERETVDAPVLEVAPVVAAIEPTPSRPRRERIRERTIAPTRTEHAGLIEDLGLDDEDEDVISGLRDTGADTSGARRRPR